MRDERSSRSLPLAYVLLIVGGLLGAHRFYLGRPISGGIQAAMGIVGILATYIAGAGLILLLLPLAAWLIVDLVRLPVIAHGPAPATEDADVGDRTHPSAPMPKAS